MYHLTYAEILLRKGWPEAAIAEAKRAIQFNGDMTKAYLLMAKAYESKQDASRAILFRSMAEKEIGKQRQSEK
jgi:predicted Zn-dependent protease